MSNPVPSTELGDQATSPETRIPVAGGVEETPVPTKAEGLEGMEPQVTTNDLKDLQVPADKEGLPATEEAPVDKGGLSVPEEEEIPLTDKGLPPSIEEHPAVKAQEEESSGLAIKKSQETVADEKVPSAEDKEQLSVSAVDDKPLPAEESPPVVTDKEDLSKALYRESPPVRAVEAPSVPADKGPAAVVSEEKPPAYRESPPAVTVEERPPIVAYKEHPPVTSVEEPPSIAAEEISGIVKEGDTKPLVSEVPEQAATPPEPPAEAVEVTGPAWDIWHTDPAENILLGTVIALTAAKFGGEVARMLKLPSVVGKIIIGMILGNIFFLTGWDFFNFLRVMPFLKHLSELGALTLLLTVGLHTDLRAVLRVGLSSFLVALGGLVAPAGLGFLVGHFLLPEAPLNTKLLLSIILCASSMGVIFKVLDELGLLHSIEGRIITGAVILDDIVALLAFGVACGIITSGKIPLSGVIITVGIISLFVSAIVITSLRYSEVLGDFVTRKVPEGLKFAIAAILCLFLAFLAESIGMHTIIGAFGAGLLLRHMRLKESDGKEYSIEWLTRPAYMLLVPIFFVRAGAQVRWESFLDIDTVFLGLAITGASVLGKLFCSLCVVERGINRLALGIAMVPKLEVTLIMASVGRGLGVLDDSIFSAFIVVILLSSTISPPLLKMVLSRRKGLVLERSSVPYEGEVITRVALK